MRARKCTRMVSGRYLSRVKTAGRKDEAKNEQNGEAKRIELKRDKVREYFRRAREAQGNE